VGLLMVDIDLFKNVNDTYGHIYGDKVIISLAEKLLSCTRREDIVVRMGGDEFLMVLIDTDLGNCAVRAEQIRYEVECMQISEEDKVSQVTISIGVAGYPESGREIQEIITRADHALYLAKATGKNKVCA
jgi:diguanylate cyclase (GGDEF)-like protein